MGAQTFDPARCAGSRLIIHPEVQIRKRELPDEHFCRGRVGNRKPYESNKRGYKEFGEAGDDLKKRKRKTPFRGKGSEKEVWGGVYLDRGDHLSGPPGGGKEVPV